MDVVRKTSQAARSRVLLCVMIYKFYETPKIQVRQVDTFNFKYMLINWVLSEDKFPAKTAVAAPYLTATTAAKKHQ